jgi:hypothetical protein
MMVMIKGDTLVEQLFNLAKKKSPELNHQERELIKRAAMRIQTLQAERYLKKYLKRDKRARMEARGDAV